MATVQPARTRSTISALFNPANHALHNPDKPGFSSRGDRLGRPRVLVPQGKIERLTREGLSLRAIAKQVGVSKTTILRASAL
jgi:hypothetical protein